MYNPKNGFGKILAWGVVGLELITTLGCAGLLPKPDFYFQEGQPKTITYIKDGQKITVPDLNGDWKTRYNNTGGHDKFEEIVRVTQNENRFKGIKTIGNEYLSAGDLTISGELEGNLVKCYTHLRSGSPIYITSKLSESVDEFECAGDEVRKYRRVK
jgi:hypothetical protein